jgi:NADPH-dependent 2,4-dienoyl-CoA reductase/sulfur reductase-like enzyme
VSSPAIEAHDSHPRDPKVPIQRLLVVADAAVAEVHELPPQARDVIDAALSARCSSPSPAGCRMSEPDGRRRVAVVGGGSGGLQAVRSLRRAPVEVTLVDRRNFHLFQPLLYQRFP